MYIRIYMRAFVRIYSALSWNWQIIACIFPTWTRASFSTNSATHCNKLQHAATRSYTHIIQIFPATWIDLNTISSTPKERANSKRKESGRKQKRKPTTHTALPVACTHTALRCNILQITATRCNTQRAAICVQAHACTQTCNLPDWQQFCRNWMRP